MIQQKSLRLLTVLSRCDGSLGQTVLNVSRSFSSTNSLNNKDSYKLLIVGGGSGGVTISAKFSKILGANNVAIVEPSEWHCKNTIFLKLLSHKLTTFF